MSLQKITKSILVRDGEGQCLMDMPYDIGFIGGYDKELVAENLENNQVYGHMIMARPGTFLGCVGSFDSSGTSQIVIEKNGVNIYSSNPSFSGSTTMVDGTLSDTSFASGDKITFKVTNYSSGQGLRLTLKCMV